jgi:hypothetical protein
LKAFALIAVLLLATASPAGAREGFTPVGPCFTLHGRLMAGNGTPAYRIWRIGTNRMLGVFDEHGENENPWFPANVKAALSKGDLIFADFTLCPMTKRRPGWMQMVTVRSASHIVAVRDNR